MSFAQPDSIAAESPSLVGSIWGCGKLGRAVALDLGKNQSTEEPKMTSQSNPSRFFHRAALIGMLALSGLAGCGGEDLSDSAASAAYALTGHVLGPYGSTSGTMHASGGNHLSTVTKIVGYCSADYIFGIKLFWGTSSVMFGQTNGASAQTFNVSGDPVTKIEYAINAGLLRGINFINASGSLPLGNLTVTSTLDLSDPDGVFTDLQTWSQTVGGTPALVGANIYYTTP